MQKVYEFPTLPCIWLPFQRSDARLGESSQCDCDCDCACPTSNTKFEFPDIASPFEQLQLAPGIKYQTSAGLYLDKVNGNYVVMGLASAGPLVLDNEALCLLELFSAPRSVPEVQELLQHWDNEVLAKAIAAFIALGILVAASQSEESQIISDKLSMLSAWLHLTDACPLDCVYCYVRSQRRRSSDQSRTRWMSVDTAHQAVQAVFRSARRHGFAGVKLKYSGGDPSLNFPALLAAQKRAELLASISGLALDTVLLSCGFFLSDYQMDILQEHAVRISISLDGIGEAHDNQRPLVNGSGSCEYVSRTIGKLITRGIRPHISITITGRNIKALPATVNYVLDHDLPFTLNFYREHEASINVDGLQVPEQEMIAGLNRTFAAIEGRLPQHSLLSGLADRANLRVPHAYTCGVGRNYLVIDPSGNISKCQMVMDTPVSHVRAEDPLTVIQTDCRGVQNLRVDEKRPCRECLWRYYCTGGCPLLAYRRVGRYDTQSPYCKVYQAIIPEILHLEALRLLNYQKPWDFEV